MRKNSWFSGIFKILKIHILDMRVVILSAHIRKDCSIKLWRNVDLKRRTEISHNQVTVWS